MVMDALNNGKWLEDIQWEISLEALLEYLELWDTLALVVLQVGIPDRHIWRLSPLGEYTAKLAYDALFRVLLALDLMKVFGKHGPPKCRFFLCTVAHKRCWIADILARRGVPHLGKCPLCDQEDEDIQHLLISCVFARHFWYSLLYCVRLSILIPTSNRTLLGRMVDESRSCCR
jgi:hypothetical protein